MSGSIVDTIRREASPFEPTREDTTALVAALGDAQLVLIGEASHGTHEFHALRAGLTRRLIAEHGFNLIALEADLHLGDALVTQKGRRGEPTLGQLVRERNGSAAWLLGFTTQTGTVISGV